MKRLTGGLAGLAKQRKVTVVPGTGRFVSMNQLEVRAEEARSKIVSFEQAIIAAGSEPVTLPFIPHDDPRVIDSTGALELDGMPQRLLVIGGGIIGLEMATVYHALGAKVTVVELMDQIIPGADKDIVTPLMKRIAKQYEAIHLKAKVTKVEANGQGLTVHFEGGSAPATDTFDRILVAVGRRPNGKLIGAENAGVAVDERGFIPVDRQMRTNVPHIFAIGDVVGQPMLAHKAVHEGKVAAEAAAGRNAFFDAKVIPSVAYTDPEVAWVGLTENEAKAKGIKYGKGVFPWAASGRSLSLGRDEGITKVLFDEATDRIIGCGIVGPSAGDLIAEAALAIEMGADAAGYRPDHPPAPDAVGNHRHGGRSLRGHDHRPLHAEEGTEEGALSRQWDAHGNDMPTGRKQPWPESRIRRRGTPTPSGVPENVRQAAETTLAQARQAIDQYLHQATNLREKVEASVQAAQAGARDINRNVLAAAEANMNATFELCPATRARQGSAGDRRPAADISSDSSSSG